MPKTLAAAIVVSALCFACGDSSPSSPTPSPPPAPPPLSASVDAVLQVQVIEQNSTFWRFSWRVRVSANGSGTCFLRTKYLNAGGLELHEGIESLTVANGTQEFTGQDLIDTRIASGVTRMEASISSCSR